MGWKVCVVLSQSNWGCGHCNCSSLSPLFHDIVSGSDIELFKQQHEKNPLRIQDSSQE